MRERAAAAAAANLEETRELNVVESKLEMAVEEIKFLITYNLCFEIFACFFISIISFISQEK